MWTLKVTQNIIVRIRLIHLKTWQSEFFQADVLIQIVIEIFYHKYN